MQILDSNEKAIGDWVDYDSVFKLKLSFKFRHI